ncbi:GNAT family N-acetyltransferase [Paenibacillus xylanilyticus]|uniref:GNAT family N-acetyltransferase n=1 Tax=Paenibacillus xylanilyticus TaxID=248903 RepID=UPI0039A092A8
MCPISNIAPLELMEMQAQTLYTMNTQQRLTGINEPEGGHAPALFIGMSSAGPLPYYHEQLPLELVHQMGHDVKLPIDIPKLMRRVETFKPVKEIWMGPAYTFREKYDEWNLNVQFIDYNNRFLLKEHFPVLMDRLGVKMPVAAYIIADSAVAVCCSARVSQRGAEASLYTVPAYRGYGYAVETVKCWQYHVQESGRIPLYSTSWDNLPSQQVARKLGLIQFGMDFSITTTS